MSLIESLYNGQKLGFNEFKFLLDNYTSFYFEAQNLAQIARSKFYENKVYLRALIEISSYCKQNCFYCGIRAENSLAKRYRMTEKDILYSAKIAFNMGFRTIVMQSGEDPKINDEFIVKLIKILKETYKGMAVTLSFGEKSYESYQKYKNAGADRYLLRHETSDIEHYKKLHPNNMSLSNRIKCLNDLKSLGFQTGAGMMIGSPFQDNNTIAKDLLFLQDFMPQMIGIGPFIHHDKTPFANFPNGDSKFCYYILSLARLIDQRALIPITTALSSLDKNSIVNGLKSGCNVLMPNLSPSEQRKNYSLYNNKKDFEIEQEDNLDKLIKNIQKLGYTVDMSIGNYNKGE